MLTSLPSPPDCQPYFDPDFGANCGQCALPADFQVQVELLVSLFFVYDSAKFSVSVHLQVL